MVPITEPLLDGCRLNYERWIELSELQKSNSKDSKSEEEIQIDEEKEPETSEEKNTEET